MSKSPEEYFQDQHLAPEPQTRGVTFSEAEISFMRKYMGLDAQDTLEKLGIKAEVPDITEQARLAPQPERVPDSLPEAAMPEPVTEAVPQELALPEAAPEPALPPAPVAAALPSEAQPVALPGDSELSAAAQALSAAASALTAAASALSGSAAAAPAAFSAESTPVAESTLEEVTTVPAPEALMEEVVAEPEPEVVTDVAEPVAEEALPEPAPVDALAAPASEPESVAAAEAAGEETPPEPEETAESVTVDRSELETFKETVDQQFMIIRAALDGLKQNGADTSLADALFRGLSTIQTSASYMGFDDIRIYAERTAGIVDQGRKTSMDFSIMTDLLGQESGIIEDMISKVISGAFGAAGLPPVEVDEAPAALPEPVMESVPELAPIPAPEAAPTQAPEEEPAAPTETVISAPAPEPVPAPAPAPVYVEAPPVDLHEEMAKEESLDIILRREAELQMVGFYIGKQEFTVPTLAVQEVIRYETPAKMPAAPQFVAGVINLRGKMTPLVHLRDMLEIRQAREAEDRFIIVCRRKGLQIGLIIERVHTMYRVPQTDIEWGVEGLLGISNADFILGLLKLNESLVGIVSVDRIIEHVLEE